MSRAPLQYEGRFNAINDDGDATLKPCAELGNPINRARLETAVLYTVIKYSNTF